MARYYDFVFCRPNYERVTVRGYGNTQRSAERSARLKLREDRKLDSTAVFVKVKTTFAGRQ